MVSHTRSFVWELRADSTHTKKTGHTRTHTRISEADFGRKSSFLTFAKHILLTLNGVSHTKFRLGTEIRQGSTKKRAHAQTPESPRRMSARNRRSSPLPAILFGFLVVSPPRRFVWELRSDRVARNNGHTDRHQNFRGGCRPEIVVPRLCQPCSFDS